MQKILKHITLDIEKISKGQYLATSKNVQGLVAQGKNFEETVEIAEDLARTLLSVRMKTNTNAQEKYQSEHIFYPMLISV